MEKNIRKCYAIKNFHDCRWYCLWKIKDLYIDNLRCPNKQLHPPSWMSVYHNVHSGNTYKLIFNKQQCIKSSDKLESEVITSISVTLISSPRDIHQIKKKIRYNYNKNHNQIHSNPGQHISNLFTVRYYLYGVGWAAGRASSL